MDGRTDRRHTVHNSAQRVACKVRTRHEENARVSIVGLLVTDESECTVQWCAGKI